MSIEDVSTMLATLHEKVDGINSRLDTLNGRVYAHEKDKADRAELATVVDEVKSNRKYIWKMSLIIASIVGGGEIIKSLF